MKKLRKIVSLLLAVVMMMSLCIAVSADSTQTVATGNGGDGVINISDVTEDATYAVYKILDLTYDETTKSYTYIVTNSNWLTFLQKAEDSTTGETYVTITEVTDSNSNTIYYATWNTNVAQDTATLQAFAQAAEKYAEDNSIDPDGEAKVASGTTILSFTELELGYYFVTSTVGSLVALDSTAKTASIVDKNDKPTVVKYVAKSNTDSTSWTDEYITADLSDEIYFRITVTGIDEISALVLHDNLPDGYSIDTSTLTIKLYSSTSDTSPADLAATTDYSYTATTNTTCSASSNNSISGCDFEIDFAALLAQYTTGNYYNKVLDPTTGGGADAYIEIIYQVKVDSSKVSISSTDSATANTNTVYMTSSTGILKEDDASVYYYDLYVYKYAGTLGTDDEALEGAVFTLYDSTANKYATFKQDSNDKYYLTGWVDTLESGCYVTTASDGFIYIYGLDTGIYSLTETTAPDGYALLADSVPVTITADSTSTSSTYHYETVANSNTVEYNSTDVDAITVQNTTNSAMPSTGGIGVTIFYVLGGVIVVAAVVLIVVLKKRTAKVDR